MDDCRFKAFERNKWPRGFTLVELLVVIAIIGVLVATLLPAIGRAKATAVTVSCLSNQRQLGVAWATYIVDFKQIPGINYNEGTYGGGPWGKPYLYGGTELYVADGSGANSGFVGLVNMGYTLPYAIGGSFNDVNTANNKMNLLDGRIYYCPGTIVSFQQHTFGLRTPWYDSFRASMGQQLVPNSGDAVVSTYYYRSGMYDIDKGLAENDARWANVSNWKRDTVSSPDAAWVANKPMLTCFWRGYNSDTGDTTAPVGENAVHGGSQTNVLTTNGSAYTYKPGTNNGRQIMPVWGWFDAGAYCADDYLSTTAPGAFYHQMPWFWVLAERRQ